jgi:hypothetical protein
MKTKTITEETYVLNLNVIKETLNDNQDSSSISKIDYNIFYDQLADIIEKNGEWKDTLSRQLLKWGFEVLSLEFPENIEFEMQTEANKRINDLLHKILINPLDQTTLEDPILEGDWVWEKWMLDDYQESFLQFSSKVISPFYGKEIEKIIPHTFAKEMLVWARSISLLTNSLSKEVIDLDNKSVTVKKNCTEVNEKQNPVLSKGKVFLYQKLAKIAVKLQNERFYREQVEIELRQQQLLIKQNEELNRQHEIRLEEWKLETKNSLEKGLENIENTKGKEIELLQSLNEERTKVNIDLKENLEKMETKLTTCEKNLQYVQSRNSQLEQELGYLQNRINKKDKCTIS